MIRSIHDRRKAVVSVDGLKKKLKDSEEPADSVPPMTAIDEAVFPVSISYEREEELIEVKRVLLISDV